MMNDPFVPEPLAALPTCSRYCTPATIGQVTMLCSPQPLSSHAIGVPPGGGQPPLPGQMTTAVSSTLCPHVSSLAEPLCGAVHRYHRSRDTLVQPGMP